MADAKLQFEIEVVGEDEFSRSIGGAANDVKKLGSETASVGELMGSFAKGVGVAGAAVGAAAIAFKSIYGAAKSFGEELEKNTAILNSFKGTLGEAIQRSNGYVSKIELMTQANKLFQGGIKATDKELANIAVAADAFADATGGDMKQAFDALTESIASGQTRALKPLGIVINETSDRAKVQEQILAELEKRYGTMSVEADSLGGKFEKVSVAIEDAKTDFLEGFAAAKGLNESFDRLGDAVLDLAKAFGVDLAGPGGGISFFVNEGVKAAAVLQTLIDRVTLLVKAAKTGNLTNVFAAAGAGAASFASDFQKNYAQGLFGVTRDRNARAVSSALATPPDVGGTKRGGGGGKKESGDVVAGSLIDAQIANADKLQAASEKRLALLDKIADDEKRIGELAADRQIKLAAESGNEERLKALQDARVTLAEKHGASELELYQMRLGFEDQLASVQAENRAQEKEALEARRAAEKEIYDQRISQIQQTTQQEVGGVLMGLKANLDANDDILTAVGKVAQARLESLAIEYAVQAAGEVAAAIATAPVGTAQHLEAAAEYGAAAALAGVGAVGLGAAMGGGGGGGRRAGGGGSSRPGPSASLYGSGGGRSQAEGGSNLTFYFNAPNLVMTEAQGGKIVKKMMDAAKREGSI